MSFILKLRFASLLSLLFVIHHVGNAQTNDRAICNRTFSFAFEHKLIEKTIDEIIITIGEQFLGTPYEPNTLEFSDSEQLVINLRGFDCVTFVENVVAISRCIKKNRLTFEEYQHEIQMLRYRDGVVNGYASRLHYFSDWIADNEKKDILKNITQKLGGKPYRKNINFMTSHRTKYRRLGSSSAFNAIRTIEDSLSNRSMYFIPTSNISNLQSTIPNGAVIAITTDQDGLDVAHTGIAVRLDNGSLHYLHAPNVQGIVKISKETLTEYVQQHHHFTGIVVVKIQEPNE